MNGAEQPRPARCIHSITTCRTKGTTLMKIAFLGSALFLAVASLAGGQAFAQAGLLGSRTDLDPLTLASGQPLAKGAL